MMVVATSVKKSWFGLLSTIRVKVILRSGGGSYKVMDMFHIKQKILKSPLNDPSCHTFNKRQWLHMAGGL